LSGPIKISAVIITFNESSNIGRCIEALLPVADEILVVDSYSTDNTQAICEQYKVRFVSHVFEGYAEQKNYGIALTNYAYVLSVDADEVLSDDLKKAILTIKKQALFDAYYLNRLTNFCGQWIKHGDWYPDRKLRLFNKEKAQWGGGAVHETLLLAVDATTQQLQGDLWHYSFTSIEQHIQQINSFTTLAAKHLYEQGKTASVYQLYLKPNVKFFWSYIVKLGFLDGYYGYVVCKNSAQATFLKYAKLKRLCETTGS